MKELTLRVAALGLLIAGISGGAMASLVAAPEIDPGMGFNALALLGGAILVIRSARRK
jgi:hypothetical protein